MAYQSPYNAYEHANNTKNQAEQILMLYSGAISFVQQAKVAAQENEHSKRYELIEKTIGIIRGLRGGLNPDMNTEVAESLMNYYNSLEILLVSVQCEDNKEEICDQIIENLRIIKETWEKIHFASADEDRDEEKSPPANNDTPPENYEPQNLNI